MPLVAGWLQTFIGLMISILDLAILIRVLLSWFPVDQHNPVVRLIFDVTEPVLVPFRRVLPRIGMIDLSPLAALVVLGFLARAVGAPLLF